MADINLNKLFNIVKPEEMKQKAKEYSTDEIQENFAILEKDEDGNVSLENGGKLFEMMYIDPSIDVAEDEYAEAMKAIAASDGDASSLSIEDFQAANEALKNYSDEAVEETEEKTKTELEEKLGFEIVSTEADKIKFKDDGTAYIEVEPWSNNNDENNCLSRIIVNNYDLGAMGIEKYSDEYYALEKAIMDANPDIYGTEEGGWRKEVGGTGRHSAVIYDGEKIVLPGLDKVEEETPEGDEETPEGDEKPPVGTASESKSKLTDNEAKSYAERLFNAMDGWGTNEKEVNDILLSDTLSPADITKIIKSFNESHNNLVDEIHNDFTDSENKQELLNAIVKNLSEAYDDGDPYAMELLCDEIFYATEGRLGTTDQFLDAVFDCASKNTLKDLVENYPKFNNNTDLYTALDKDLGFSEDQYNHYMDILSEAVETDAKEEDKKPADPSENGEDRDVGTAPDTQAKLTDSEAKSYAERLFNAMDGWGTNEKQVTDILLNDNLSPADITKIIKFFNESHNNLVDEIHNDFTEDENKQELLNAIVENLSKAFDSGDPYAMELLCDEIFYATEGRLGTTDQFLDAVFNSASKNTLKALVENYPKFNNNTDLYTALDKDLGFSEDQYNNYVEALSKAVEEAE